MTAARWWHLMQVLLTAVVVVGCYDLLVGALKLAVAMGWYAR